MQDTNIKFNIKYTNSSVMCQIVQCKFQYFSMFTNPSLNLN